MPGDRVEKLESRVQELEASVEGLTDELVECKVRLRELENAVDDDLGLVPTDGSRHPDAGVATDQEGERTADTHKREDVEETAEETDSEIIIA